MDLPKFITYITVNVRRILRLVLSIDVSFALRPTSFQLALHLNWSPILLITMALRVSALHAFRVAAHWDLAFSWSWPLIWNWALGRLCPSCGLPPLSGRPSGESSVLLRTMCLGLYSDRSAVPHHRWLACEMIRRLASGGRGCMFLVLAGI